MQKLFKRLWREEEGQDLTEYGLLLVLVALIAVTAMTNLGKAVNNAFFNAAASMTTATNS